MALAFDRQQVEVVAQLAPVANHLELHRQEVPDARHHHPGDATKRFEHPDRRGLEELQPGGAEEDVQRLPPGLGIELLDGQPSGGRQDVSEPFEIDGFAEEEVEVAAHPVLEMDGDRRAPSEVGGGRNDVADR
ncbi:MAG TPA: hypothetical protein VEY96_01915, partial [Actinomycetes bacterium]|nr:hypothetical protein [Actinomycetes bacterium]